MAQQKKKKTVGKRISRTVNKEIAMLRSKMPGLLKNLKAGSAVVGEEAEKVFVRIKPGIKHGAKHGTKVGRLFTTWRGERLI